MSEYEVNAHSGVSPSKKIRQLELTIYDVMKGIPFEFACFRHLTKDAIKRSETFEKVVIVHENQRKVIKKDGMSTRPYYESSKGQMLGYAEEKAAY
jgi:hypothetical protein